MSSSWTPNFKASRWISVACLFLCPYFCADFAPKIVINTVSADRCRSWATVVCALIIWTDVYSNLTTIVINPFINMFLKLIGTIISLQQVPKSIHTFSSHIFLIKWTYTYYNVVMCHIILENFSLVWFMDFILAWACWRILPNVSVFFIVSV